MSIAPLPSADRATLRLEDARGARPQPSMTRTSLVQIIEDNRALATGIRNVLEIEGYRVRVDHDGVSGMSFARTGHPDLVILDLMLPEMDGYQLLRALRAAGATMPVLILSARGEERDKVHGFRIGADDYVTKPFSLLELTARVAALLRRAKAAGPHAPADGVLVVGDDIRIDLHRRTVHRAGEPVVLAPKQFDLLAALAARGTDVASRAEVLREVWGYRSDVTSRTLDMHILELRRKLETDASDPRLILTVRGVGYRLAR
jgi:DNA-binding response OmpR family regulator